MSRHLIIKELGFKDHYYIMRPLGPKSIIIWYLDPLGKGQTGLEPFKEELLLRSHVIELCVVPLKEVEEGTAPTPARTCL